MIKNRGRVLCILHEALLFLAFVWGFIVFLGGVFATIGLLVFPFSAQPSKALAIGAAGLITSLIGAAIMIAIMHLGRRL